jgi:hypothetical protein
MKPKVDQERSATVPNFKRAIAGELTGNLILLIPAALVLCAGLLLARVVESHLDQRHSGTPSPLTAADAQVQLSHCPVLRGDNVLNIERITASSTEQRRVVYEYRATKTSNTSSGTAQFAWQRGAWHAVACR